MSDMSIDARGLRCPQPIQKVITSMHMTQPGDVISVTADCPTFEDDIRMWCERTGKTMLAVNHSGADITAQIKL